MATFSDSALPRTAVVTKRRGLLDCYFYFAMSLLIPAVVVFGFSFTIGDNLLHPTVPRPPILYLHAAVFSGWLVFFFVQSILVRTHHVPWHRKIGWFGAGVGALMPVLGVATAIVMTRFNVARLHFNVAEAESFLLIPLFDMLCFASTLALAIYWRKKPEFHRRLILIATCALTAAAFARFPERLLPNLYFYSGVDFLILLGVGRDMIVNRRVHQVYWYALPAFIVGQTIVTYTIHHNLPYWTSIAHEIIR